MENKILTDKELQKVNGGTYSSPDPEIPHGREISFSDVDKSYVGKTFYVLNINNRNEWAFCKLLSIPGVSGLRFRAIRTKDDKEYYFNSMGNIYANGIFITNQSKARLLLID